jgi:O-antigen ligase
MVAIHRATLYGSATIHFVYLFNAPDDIVEISVGALAWFWAGIIVLGLLAIAFSSFELNTPIERLLPGGLIRSNYILDMTHVRLAQIHDFLGFPVGRPTGPFAYTNQWGSAFALLVPFVIVARALRPRPWHWLAPLLGAIGLVPLVVSLDRGAWLSLALGGAYVVFRLAMRAQLGSLARLLLTVALLGCIILLTPLGGLIQERIEVPHSNESRLEIYGQVIDEVARQPLFGFGGPQEAQGPYLPPLGTQGAFWLVLYSHGVPGAAFFVGFFVYAFWRSRGAVTPIAFAAHVVILIALIQLPYYGLLPAGIHILMAAAALSFRYARHAFEPERVGRTADGSATQ